MIKERKIIKVGIADLNIVTPPDSIRTSGLGSCVGVVLYDRSKQLAGLSHVLLPDSTSTKQCDVNPYKYADTAIPILMDMLLTRGARKFALKAKLAGGAQMFPLTTRHQTMRIGERNVEAVKRMLHHLQIPIVSSDYGGNVGRTIEFDPVTCRLSIRKVNQEAFFI